MLEITLEKIHCGTTNDAFLHGNDDEIGYLVTTGAGYEYRRLCDYSELITGIRDGQERYIGKVIYDIDWRSLSALSGLS